MTHTKLISGPCRGGAKNKHGKLREFGVSSLEGSLQRPKTRRKKGRISGAKREDLSFEVLFPRVGGWLASLRGERERAKPVFNFVKPPFTSTVGHRREGGRETLQRGEGSWSSPRS